MAQVRGLGPKVGGRLAPFCIHRVNRVYGALVVTALCDRSFAVAGPRMWNSLPAGIRDPTLSSGTFATLLKTYLFV